MKIILFSKIPILLEVNGQTIELEPTKSVEIDENSILKIFPLENNFLPVVVKVNDKSNFLKKIIFPDYVMLEIVNLPQIFTGEFFLSKNIKNGTSSVIGKPYKFNVEIGGITYSHNIKHNLQNIRLVDRKNIVVLESDVGDMEYDVVFHKKEKKFYEFYGEVEITDESIKAVIDKNTLARHGEVVEYKISAEKCELISKDSVYFNEKPCAVPPFLTHIAFFEAIKEKDFNLAKTYLSKELAEKLTISHLEEFFEDFTSFKVFNKNGEIKVVTLCEKNSFESNAKEFSFVFDKDKIAEIREEN